MNEVGFGELIVRMLISLTVVLALVGIAYAVLRRRNGLAQALATHSTRAARSSSAGRSRRTSHTRGSSRRRGLARPARAGRPARGAQGALQVMGRTGLSRTTSVIALQFADRVLLVGTSENAAPAVLAEVDVEAWTLAAERDVASRAPERVTELVLVPDGDADGAPPARPAGLLEALREATTRRA